MIKEEFLIVNLDTMQVAKFYDAGRASIYMLGRRLNNTIIVVRIEDTENDNETNPQIGSYSRVIETHEVLALGRDVRDLEEYMRDFCDELRRDVGLDGVTAVYEG